MIMKFFRLTALPAFLLLATSITAVGQVNTATIYGEVTDPSQAATPGAQLQLRNQLTGTLTSTKSNESGQFTFNYVPLGRYTLSVERAGFQPQELTGLELSAGRISSSISGCNCRAQRNPSRSQVRLRS